MYKIIIITDSKHTCRCVDISRFNVLFSHSNVGSRREGVMIIIINITTVGPNGFRSDAREVLNTRPKSICI